MAGWKSLNNTPPRNSANEKKTKKTHPVTNCLGIKSRCKNIYSSLAFPPLWCVRGRVREKCIFQHHKQTIKLKDTLKERPRRAVYQPEMDSAAMTDLNMRSQTPEKTKIRAGQRAASAAGAVQYPERIHLHQRGELPFYNNRQFVKEDI